MIVGLDTASNRFHWVADDGSFGSCRAKRGNKDVQRMDLFVGARTLFGNIERLGALDNHQPTSVFCEEPLALQNGKTTRLLGLAAGAIWAAHLEFNIWWHWVDVATWKKLVLGKGNLKKDQIAWTMLDREMVPENRREAYARETDFYDAHCLMLYGKEFMSNAQRTGSFSELEQQSLI